MNKVSFSCYGIREGNKVKFGGTKAHREGEVTAGQNRVEKSFKWSMHIHSFTVYERVGIFQ